MFKKLSLVFFILIFFNFQSVLSAESPRWVAQPVYVYIPSCGNYSKLMYKAFLAWQEKSDGLVRFKFVSRKSSANIEVHFVNKVENCNSEFAVGCERTQTRHGQYYKSDIEIALKKRDSDNVYRPIKNIYGVMLHEIGHAIGLDHSNNPDSIMYSYDLPTLQYLTEEDVRLLYKKYH